MAEENKTLNKESVSSIGYTGSIVVTVKKGKKVISTKTYHNNGRWPLFYFLCTALKGDYTLAETFRPKYINIFSYGAIGDPMPVVQEGTPISEYLSNRLTLSTYPVSSVANVTTTESTAIGSASVTYHFVIPFTHINAGQSPLNVICLYGLANTQQNLTNPSMFYFVPNADGNLGTIIDPALISAKANEYNLFIDWTMTFTNA